MKNGWGEKLKDPRWQKMRLKIMERDSFICQVCCDGESTLNVHHRYYLDVENPWDYPDEALVTLCESCHEQERTDRPASEEALLEALKIHFFARDLQELANAFEEARLVQVSELVTSALCSLIKDYDLQRKMVDDYFERLLNKKALRGKDCTIFLDKSEKTAPEPPPESKNGVP